jgi:hypothetical protein
MILNNMTKEEPEKLYYRDDPDSEEAGYSPEIGEDIDVGASLTLDGTHGVQRSEC